MYAYVNVCEYECLCVFVCVCACAWLMPPYHSDVGWSKELQPVGGLQVMGHPAVMPGSESGVDIMSQSVMDTLELHATQGVASTSF